MALRGNVFQLESESQDGIPGRWGMLPGSSEGSHEGLAPGTSKMAVRPRVVVAGLVREVSRAPARRDEAPPKIAVSVRTTEGLLA